MDSVNLFVMVAIEPSFKILYICFPSLLVIKLDSFYYIMSFNILSYWLGLKLHNKLLMKIQINQDQNKNLPSVLFKKNPEDFFILLS